MKPLKPIIVLAIILAISSISALLYLDQHYISSALLTIVWVVWITRWIGERRLKIRKGK